MVQMLVLRTQTDSQVMAVLQRARTKASARTRVGEVGSISEIAQTRPCAIIISRILPSIVRLQVVLPLVLLSGLGKPFAVVKKR